ncbi:hypothetical protein ACHAXT_012340 [Thalassiosira profunda]
MATSDTLQTIAGTLGNVLEWYDFGIYGFFSDTIAQVFFPPSNTEHQNLILSYVVFGGAFLVRPIGGCITGHIGDKHGRKRALVFSLFCMSVPTVAMGVLPTYEMAGAWSTALLVICRLLQGFSVGGQLPSSIVYTLETKPKEHWGYYGSFVNMASNAGVIVGNLVGALIRQLLSDEQLLAWGWRVAFLSGAAILPVAIFLRVYGREHNPNEDEYLSTTESPAGEEESTEPLSGMAGLSASLREKHPLKEALRRDNWAALTSSILVPMLYGGGYWITVIWLAVYMETLISNPIDGAFWINLAANVFGLTLPSFFTGWLSDRVSRVKIMCFGAISTGVAGPFLLWVISRGNTWEALFAQMGICLLLSFYCGPFCTWLVERFPPKVRLSSVSLGFNLGICISAGFSPALATALVKVSPVAPGILYPSFAVLGLIGMAVSTRVHQDGGVDDDEKEDGDSSRTESTRFVEDDLSTHLL